MPMIVSRCIVRIDNLCCAAEARIARALLTNLDDVVDVKISIAERRAAIDHRPTLLPAEIVNVLNSKQLGASLSDSASTATVQGTFSLGEILRASASAAQISLFGLAVGLHLGHVLPTVSLMCAWASIILSFPMMRKACAAIQRRSPNVELLMALAAGGSLLLGDVIEAASVGAIVSLMDAVKMFAIERFERQLRGATTTGKEATVDIKGGGSLAVSAIAKGTVYIARAGDALPADGMITGGRGAVDESRLTGEALPQSKEKGSAVSGGSIVATGYLEVTALAPASESFQARIADAVKDAQSTLSDAEELVGRFARYYTPAVLLIGALLGIAKRSLQESLVVIVAGCPCALLGAAPFAHAAAVAALASRHQLLVKHSTGIEALAHMNYIGLDKTGTLTKGQFQLLDLVVTADGYDRDTLHRWAAAVEARDSHPIARSVVQSYTGCLVDFAGSDALPEVEDFKRHERYGVAGNVDGRYVGVGNADFVAAMGIRWETVGVRAQQVQAKYAAKGGRTLLYVLVDGAVAAMAVLEDTLRPTARATIHRLRSLGVRPLLLTGDKGEPAERVATATGIAPEDVHAGLLPNDKQRLVLRLSHTRGERGARSDGGDGYDSGQGASSVESGEVTVKAGVQSRQRQPLMADLPSDVTPTTRGPTVVGFVGDGLNDCAALASAHVGVVLQQVGSQATVDASSAVLQSADIGQLPAAIILARRTMRLIWFNVILALSMNLGVIVAAATIGLPLWLSVAMDNLGLVVVLANSAWPLFWRVASVTAEEAPNDVYPQRHESQLPQPPLPPSSPALFVPAHPYESAPPAPAPAPPPPPIGGMPSRRTLPSTRGQL